MQAHQPAFRLLGPLEVWADGAPLRLGGDRQRALLALLLLHANEVVPSDRLIEQLFGLNAPETAANALQVAVSRLRRLLGDGVLVTRPRGYLLQVEPGQLDTAVFDQLLAAGRDALADGDPSIAAARLREGLALWRGPPLADLASLEVMQPDIRRLEELHLAALMDRVDADLALGQGAPLVPELEELVDANPYQERLRGQLMLALYRSGRQADALDAYRRTRELLRDELGLQPGTALQQLEREILNHDPALDPSTNGAPTATAASTGEPAPTPAGSPTGRRGRRRWIVAAGAALLLIAAAVLAFTQTRGSKHGLPGVGADSIGVIDPHGDRITAQLPLGARPVGIATANGVLWVSASNGTLTRAEPDRLAGYTTIPLGGNPGAVAVGAGAVWVADQDTGMVSRIDLHTRLPVDKIRVGNGPSAATFCAGSVWVVNQTDATVVPIDPKTDQPGRPIPVGSAPSGIACSGRSVWVADAQEGTVRKIDPVTRQTIGSATVGGGPAAITTGLGAVWVGSSQDRTVWRINPATGKVTATISAGQSVDALAIHDGSIWAGNAASGTIARIDPASQKVVGRVHVGSSPTSLVAAGNRLVVSTVASPASHRGGTLVTAGDDGVPVTLDPATWWSPLGWSLMSITNDGLVTFRRAAGAAGLVVVPDLAGSLPVVSRGGTVQTFVLRRGMRYSGGRPVRASDVRASIERLWRMKAPVTSLGLVGESACAARPRRCDLSRGILTDDRARTVSFHLDRPNPFFLNVLATPNFSVLPSGTPPRDGHRLPATGPYRIVSYKPGRQVVLERNPGFRVWSAAAQPAGFPDRIVARLVRSPNRALDDVLDGRADYLVSQFSVPSGRLAELLTHRASQLHAPQQLVGRYLFLNTQVPPFDRRDVRRALNYAIDRDDVVRIHGGPHAASLTCQVITPAFPGYRPYCPYTLHPNRAGTWIGPDLDRAKALVRRSGTQGMKVVVWAGWGTTGFDRTTRPTARYVARVLDELGYDASVATLPVRNKDGSSSPYYDHVLDPRSRVQLGLATWAPDLPTTSSLIQPLLGCGEYYNLARFCNPQVGELIQRAVSLEGSDKAAATRLWTESDHRVVDEAPWVPLLTFQWTDVVSQRLGNYQSGPRAALGFLIDQAWVR